MESTEDMVLRYQSTGHDEELFRKIYEHFVPAIAGIIQKVPIEEDRKDVKNECAVALWKTLVAWSPAKGPFAAYFGKTISNICNNYFRSYYRRRAHEDAEFLNPKQDDIPLDHKKELGQWASEASGSKFAEFCTTWNTLIRSCENLAVYPIEKLRMSAFGLTHRLCETKNAAQEAIASFSKDAPALISLSLHERALLARMLVRRAPSSQRRAEPLEQKPDSFAPPVRRNLCGWNQNARLRAENWQFWANMS